MFLLVYDLDYVSHSVDVVRRNLMPELSKLVDRIIWLVPESRKNIYEPWVRQCSNVSVKGFSYDYFPRRHPFRYMNSILRRVEQIPFSRMGIRSPNFTSLLRRISLNSLIGGLKPDIIFCPVFMNEVVPRVDIPITGILYDLSPYLSPESLQNIDRWINASSIYFCISEFTRAKLRIRLDNQHYGEALVLPLCPGFTPQILSSRQAPCPNETKPLVWKSNDAQTVKIIFPAALTEWKGHMILFKAINIAMKSGFKLELVLIGKATETLSHSSHPEDLWLEETKRLYCDIQKNGAIVHALGHVKEEVSVSRIMLAADVVIFPSLYEGFGLPISEAVMHGLPVIASDLPPIREQLALYQCHDRVRLVPPADPDALAAVLIDFANGFGPKHVSPDEMQVFFQRWTWSDVAHKVVSQLECILSGPTRAMDL